MKPPTEIEFKVEEYISYSTTHYLMYIAFGQWQLLFALAYQTVEYSPGRLETPVELTPPRGS